MVEFDPGLPSVRQIQGFIKEGQEVEIKLLTQDVLLGQIRWQDQHCICLNSSDGQPMVVWRHAIAYIKPQNGDYGSRALQTIE